MITIEHHPTDPDKYLMIFAPSNFTLTISEKEHQAILDYGRPEIKLHPMSEEPKKHGFIFLYSENFGTKEAYYNDFCGEWEVIIKSHPSKGWLYPNEVSQLIKNNTAP